MSMRAATPAPDRLSSLLERFRVQAALFHSGPLCGQHVFEPQPGRAFLHILRQGEMEVRHPGGDSALPRLKIDTPSLLLYPQPLHHVFFNAPLDGPDFTCATLDFDGGARNPIVQSLPPVMVVPLAAITELDDTLQLLFAEADRQRCGSRLLTNRLFEVALIQILRWVVDHPDAAGVSHGLMRGLSDARLARALVAMHQAPQDEWTLPRMAATAGMSRSAFAAVFKDVMQATPASYLLGLAAEPGLRAAAGRRGGQAGGDRGGVCRYRFVVEGVPQAAGGVAEGVVGRGSRAGWVKARG